MKISRGGPVPEYYEQATMATGPRAALWLAGIVLAVVGILSGALATEPSVRFTISPLASTAGALILLAAWRLGQYEVLVTRNSLRAGFVPLPRLAPRDSIHSMAARPATGWRRLFAAQELFLSFGEDAAEAPLAIPSNAPDELARALES